MPTINERIYDGQVRHSIWLERYKSGTVSKMIALLNKADKDLAEQIAARLTGIEGRGYDLGKDGTKRLNALLDDVRERRIELYKLLDEETREQLNEFSVHEADFQAALIEASIAAEGVELTLQRPAMSLLRAATMSRPFQGRLLREWYSGLATRSAQQVNDAIRIGIVEGQTTDQIIRRIRGTRAAGYTDGILNMTRHEASVIIRTAVAHVANSASEDLFLANADILEGEQWVSTLDSHTTPICRQRDGKVYPVGKGPKCPAHMGCRSRKVPYLGETSIPGIRASQAGPVAANIKYADWLKKQSVEVQQDALGIKKAQLFRDGKLPLDRFYDPTGQEYTLAELKKRDATVWNKVFKE